MPNELANKIIASIEPFVGRVVAQAGIKTQCKKIGKTLDTIERSDLPALADYIAEAMKFFGKDETAIRNAIRSI